MKPVRDQAVIEGYLSDASNTRGEAEALFRPESASEVAAVLQEANRCQIPVTVTARRTSTTGGPVPHGGWLLSTERLSTIHSVNEADAGVLLGEYQTHTETHGRLFPPDPTSRHEASLGAVIACNASGARSYAYGPTRPWVEGVEVVLPTGEVLYADRSTPIPSDWPRVTWTPPEVKTAAGYHPADNLLDLMIGQEGTLGVITRAKLRLTALPSSVMGVLAFFPTRSALLRFVETARQERHNGGSTGSPGALSPRAIEYFDHHALEMVRRRVPDIPDDAVGALFCEVEHECEAPLEIWWDALESHGALVDNTVVTEDDAGRARLHAIRHAIPAGVNEQIIANNMPKVGTDFAVPDHALAEMMDAYAAVDLPHICFGHIGDNHLHLNLLPRTADELAHARELYVQLARRAVALGGTVSAEHGIGKIKRHLLAEMAGTEAIREFRALKGFVDPNNILGRGTLI